MDINQLITIVKKKITGQVVLEEIIIEDKSYLHKNHKGNEKGKFHLKIFIKSNNLKSLSKIDSNKKIYKILNEEMKTHIHSLQILVS